MYLLFNSWIGLLEILDSTGKLAIVPNCSVGYAIGVRHFFGCVSSGNFFRCFSLHGSRLGHGLLRPVVDPATEQAGGVGV